VNWKFWKKFSVEDGKSRREAYVRAWTGLTEPHCPECDREIMFITHGQKHCHQCGTRIEYRKPTRCCCELGHDNSRIFDRHCRSCGGRIRQREFNPDSWKWELKNKTIPKEAK
jgi:hypothetical protein